LRVGLWIREFLLNHTQREREREIVRGSQSNVKCTTRECIGSAFVSSLCK
jgi:hypothetical protein